MGISDKVVFCGMIHPKNVPLYYQLGDLFLCASRSETQGITYIEAMASGVPVLCRRDDCLVNVVDNGINGLSYQNYWDFSEAFQRILENPEYAKQLSERARQKAEEYSMEKFAEKVLDCYHMAIKSYKGK